MADSGRQLACGPAAVSIMRQGDTLIVSVHTALNDSQLARFQQDLNHRIGEHRTRRVIIDVAALDVVDSFAAHILSNCATMARLRGAELTVVGIQPEVVLAMVELDLDTAPAHTALDLQDGLEYAIRPPLGWPEDATLQRPPRSPREWGGITTFHSSEQAVDRTH